MGPGRRLYQTCHHTGASAKAKAQKKPPKGGWYGMLK